MKKLLIILITCCSMTISAQIGNFTAFPTMRPHHILDENQVDISFAFSLRILESNYTGPIIRLRRSSDNAQQDFFCGPDDRVDIDAINTWRNGANVFVVRWYDQSNQGRDAVQNSTARQMRFFPLTTTPYMQGDGTNDHLTIDTPNGLQDVTTAGRGGSVLMVTSNTRRQQNGFGVIAGSNRWLAHTNWVSNSFFFDPGRCCNNPRSFGNASNENQFAHYSLIRSVNTVLMRANAVTRASGAFTIGRCTLTSDFSIGWSTSNSDAGHATTRFTEFIMYSRAINATRYEAIEDDAIQFWGL